MPATKVTVLSGQSDQVGPPVAGSYFAGSDWIPAKMVANRTERKVKTAESRAPFARVSKSLLRETHHEMIAPIAENPTVQRECPVTVLRYLAMTRT